MYYFLMHRNKKVAMLEIDIGLHAIGRVAINSDETEHLPIGITNIKCLREWISNRSIPDTRYGVVKTLLRDNITPIEYMVANMGLSLTDNYWLKPRGLNRGWEEVNLYDNWFEAQKDLDIYEGHRELDELDNTSITPSASLKGDLKKKWVIAENGDRILIKGNYNNTCRQSIAEVFASEMHRKQSKFPYTRYKLVRVKSDNQYIIGCGCKNFTTNSTEFVPAIDVVRSVAKDNSKSYYEAYIECCEEHGIDNIRKFMEYQIMTDFIISNNDRHLNNFGILRDSRTLNWLEVAPIFDSGNSLFYKSSYIPVDRGLLDLDVTSFLNKEVKLLKYVKDRGLVDIRKLPSSECLYKLLSIDNNTKEETNERIIRAYERKIEYLDEFQNGAELWSYKYLHSK